MALDTKQTLDTHQFKVVGTRPLRVYVSDETHTWIQKAADLFGIGTDAIRWIPTDAALRMDPKALTAQGKADEALEVLRRSEAAARR